jgi:hypothetical protein
LHITKCPDLKNYGEISKEVENIAKSLKEDRSTHMEAALMGVLTNPIKLPQELFPPPCCHLCASTVLVN